MKKSKISPLKPNQNDKILLGDELDDSGPVEYICPQCNTNSIVTITDGVGNSNLFCKRCSTVFSEETDTIRHKSRLSVPQENEEVAISTTPTIGADAVAITHPKELRGGIAELAKRGLKITYFDDSSQR